MGSLEKLNVTQLREIAKDLKIKYYTKKNKRELVELITNIQNNVNNNEQNNVVNNVQHKNLLYNSSTN